MANLDPTQAQQPTTANPFSPGEGRAGLALAGNPAWPACREYPVQRWQSGQPAGTFDHVIEEAPVAIGYNGQSHAVMLATPLDLEDFAVGFSLTEGIVETPAEIAYIQVYHRADGIEVWLRIPEERFAALDGKERNLTGRTGCGLCGTANLSQAVRCPAPVRSGITLKADELREALAALARHQTLNRLTGAVHGAAWVVPGQGIVHAREDVGRHNALDKLIGALIRSGEDAGTGFVIVTSRASFEMVQKCASVGIGLMAAISAPTGLAIRLAEQTGLSLVGFARGNNFVVYANPWRLIA